MSSVPVPEGPPSPYSDDLALAGACLSGDEAAWERLIATYRPILYRAADAIDPSGSSRDLADGLFADLYGLRERDGQRQSLLRYYQGRSRLGTWLRAVLAQRHIDKLRANRRHEPLEKIEQAEQIGQTDLLLSAPPDDADSRARALCERDATGVEVRDWRARPARPSAPGQLLRAGHDAGGNWPPAERARSDRLASPDANAARSARGCGGAVAERLRDEQRNHSGVFSLRFRRCRHDRSGRSRGFWPGSQGSAA